MKVRSQCKFPLFIQSINNRHTCIIASCVDSESEAHISLHNPIAAHLFLLRFYLKTYLFHKSYYFDVNVLVYPVSTALTSLMFGLTFFLFLSLLVYFALDSALATFGELSSLPLTTHQFSDVHQGAFRIVSCLRQVSLTTVHYNHRLSTATVNILVELLLLLLLLGLLLISLLLLLLLLLHIFWNKSVITVSSSD